MSGTGYPVIKMSFRTHSALGETFGTFVPQEFSGSIIRDSVDTISFNTVKGWPCLLYQRVRLLAVFRICRLHTIFALNFKSWFSTSFGVWGDWFWIKCHFLGKSLKPGIERLNGELLSVENWENMSSLCFCAKKNRRTDQGAVKLQTCVLSVRYRTLVDGKTHTHRRMGDFKMFTLKFSLTGEQSWHEFFQKHLFTLKSSFSQGIPLPHPASYTYAQAL